MDSCRRISEKVSFLTSVTAVNAKTRDVLIRIRRRLQKPLVVLVEDIEIIVLHRLPRQIQPLIVALKTQMCLVQTIRTQSNYHKHIFPTTCELLIPFDYVQKLLYIEYILVRSLVIDNIIRVY